MDTANFVGITLSLVFSAYFSGTEIAFVSSNKLYFELQKKQGSLAANIITSFYKRSSIFIAALLVGNTLALVVYGIYMADVLDPILMKYLPEPFNHDVYLLIVQSILSTGLVLVVAEFLPKAIFRLNPDRMLEILAIPTYLIYWFLYLPVSGFVMLSKFLIVRVFRLNYSEEQPVYRLTDLNNYINNTVTAQNDAEEAEIDTKIFSNAITFKNTKVRECMTPRTEIIAIDINDGLEALRKVFLESEHSKVLIYRNDINDVLGYCHSLALFHQPESIESIVKEVFFIPETAHAQHLLVRLIAEKRSLAVVLDEFGGTSGLVTIEDLMEEIFGDIQDEYDEDEMHVRKIDDHNFELSARLHIESLNEKYHWNIPEGEYETLGGYILSVCERIPSVGEVISEYPFTFTILSMEYSRLDVVRLSISPEYLHK